MWRWEREDGRFYEVVFSEDLLKNLVVYKLYGGKRRNGTQTTGIPCNTISEAIEVVKLVHATRLHRGYKLVIDDPFTNIHDEEGKTETT